MKKLFFLASLLGIVLLAQAQNSYTMYETFYIKPKADKLEEFDAALAAHNKKFHAEGPSGNIIRYVSVGEHAGEYVWAMGPLTFTDLDTRPAGDAHDDDWNRVMPYVGKISDVELWKLDPNLSSIPEGYKGSSKLHIRAFDVKPGRSEDMKGLLEQIVEVMKTTADDDPWFVYWNMFSSGNGRDVAAVAGFEKWAEYDEEDTWVKDFEGVHGKESWKKAMVLMSEISSLTEEVRELVPELGGKTQ